MNWADIAKQVVAAGAPAIGGALAGPVGAQVGNALAGILQVPATPDDVADRIASMDPLLVKGLDASPSTASPDLAAWLQTHAAMAAQLAEIESKSPSFFDRGWRPAMSWLTAFMWIWNAVLLPVTNAATGASIPSIPYEHLVGFSGLWLAIYGGGHTVKSIFGNGASHGR
jgi:hypothetical protein